MKQVMTMQETNQVGRPPKFEQSLVRHLKKNYSNKQFTSTDVLNSFRLQLIGYKTKPQVKLGMELTRLRKLGIIKTVGEFENGKRGVNNKIYEFKGV